MILLNNLMTKSNKQYQSVLVPINVSYIHIMDLSLDSTVACVYTYIKIIPMNTLRTVKNVCWSSLVRVTFCLVYLQHKPQQHNETYMQWNGMHT